MEKKEIRNQFFSLRKSIIERYLKEKKIIEKIKNQIVAKEGIISGYYPSRNEVNILPLLEDLIKNDFRICLPFIKKPKFRLFFKKWDNGSKLINGKFNIKVPDNDDFLEPSVLLVPLLAFDSGKNRLGYGGGYYDRTISFLEKKKEIFTIGVAFDEQQIEKVPAMSHDKKLNLIVTQTRVIR